MPYSILQGRSWCTWCIEIKVSALLQNENNKKKDSEGFPIKNAVRSTRKPLFLHSYL